MSDFNPYDYVESIKGKPYLPTQYRIAWFRAVHPTGAIITNPVEISGVLMVRTEIYSGDNVLLATGMATIRDQAGQTWTGRVIEKAETAAIARALAHAGFEIKDTSKMRANAAPRATNQPHDRQSHDAPQNAPTPANGANSGNSDGILKTDVTQRGKIKVKDGAKYLVIAGITFFGGELLRPLFPDFHVSELNPGDVMLPAPIRVQYELDANGYKQPVRVEAS